jgi:AcrR family transcriptional regulator
VDGIMGAVTVERLTRERRRELTREALIRAARELFARRGFHGASLEEIADAAGFTRGAIYKNFATKEELFFAVFDAETERQLATLSDALDESARDVSDVSALIEAWNRLRHRDWFILTLEFRLYALRNPEVRERFSAHQRLERDKIARFLEAQAEAYDVRFKVAAETLAVIFQAASFGFADAANLFDEEPVFDTFVELFSPAIVEPATTRSTSSAP